MSEEKHLSEIAEILGNGYKCYLNLETKEVLQADAISLEERTSDKFREYTPLEGKVMFGFMKDFCSQISDFEKQSEMMETLLYEQPFQNFKSKVYSIGLADDWLAYRTKRIVETLR